MLTSPGLLPDAMTEAVVRAASVSVPSNVTAPDLQESLPTIQIGDAIVLGRKECVRGTVKYVGPVLWDASGDVWVSLKQTLCCDCHACHGVKCA